MASERREQTQITRTSPVPGGAKVAHVDAVDKPRWKFIQIDTDRHGNRRVYLHRRGGPKIRVRCSLSSPEFAALYKDFLAEKPIGHFRKRVVGSFVYCVGLANGNGPIKIGITKKIKTRLSALQLASPQKLSVRSLYAVANMKMAREIEAHLHRCFADRRKSGEWFSVAVKDVEAAIYDIAWDFMTPIKRIFSP